MLIPINSTSETLAVAGTAVAFTSVPGAAKFAKVQVQDAPIRFYRDGSTPTASAGERKVAGEIFWLLEKELALFKAIREGGTSAAVAVTYYTGEVGAEGLPGSMNAVLVSTQTTVTLANDVLLTLGTGGDIVLVERSTALTANTALTDVILGTPVTQALAADSLIISNVTASGDIIIVANRGGNSESYLFIDSSAGTLDLKAPLAAITLTPTTDTLLANGTGLVVGHTAQVTISDGDGATNLIPEVQVLGTTKTDSSILLAAFNTTDTAAVGPSLAFLKSGNAAIGSQTIVASGEVLGSIVFYGDDGVDYEAPAAAIRGEVDNTPGAGDMPGRIVFLTTTDAGETLTERVRIDSTGKTTFRNTVHLGLAGTALGVLELDGNTSGTVTINTAAAAGTWTFTLPPDDGDAGEQLQTNGSGVTTWEAAASTRQVKNLLGKLDPAVALDRILKAPIHRFTYRKGERGVGGDFDTEFAGIVADEAPWAMKHKGRIFNEISAFGHAAAAIQALTARVAQLEAQLA